MLVCVSSHNFAHETAGAARTRSSLRPLLSRRDKVIAKLGRFMPREWEAATPSTASFRGARTASPESILTVVVMDSGRAPSGAARNDDKGERTPAGNPRNWPDCLHFPQPDFPLVTRH